VIGALLFGLILIIYCIIMKTCCKRDDYDEGEEIDAISSTDILKQIKIEEKKEGTS